MNEIDRVTQAERKLAGTCLVCGAERDAQAKVVTNSHPIDASLLCYKHYNLGTFDNGKFEYYDEREDWHTYEE